MPQRRLTDELGNAIVLAFAHKGITPSERKAGCQR